MLYNLKSLLFWPFSIDTFQMKYYAKFALKKLYGNLKVKTRFSVNYSILIRAKGASDNLQSQIRVPKLPLVRECFKNTILQ